MITQQLVEVSGRKVDLRRAGSGEPFVYLHSSVGEFWMPEFLEKLLGRFEVIVPAHPGFGESTVIEDIADVEDLAFHYSDLFRELEIQDPVLCGLSLGGWIAAEIAVRWPDPVRALVLIDPVGIWLDEAPISPIWGVESEVLVETLFADHSHPLAQLMLSIDLDDPPPEEILLQFISQQSATAKIGWDPYLHDPKLASRLSRISSPSLVLWGEDDRMVSPTYGKHYASLIPGARFETVPGGHLAALENPEAVAGAIANFLAS